MTHAATASPVSTGEVIRLAGLTYTYPCTTPAPADARPHLADIDLAVRAGECVILAGTSGCGKTTLTRVLNGLAPQFFGGTVAGEYRLCGRNALDIPIHELGTQVASVFQDPRSQFFATNTTDEVALGMENVPLPRAEMHARLAEMSALLGIDRLFDRRIFPLSSGEKQRVAIASAAVMRPRALVLDEPSANLDAEGIAHLGTLLSRLKERGCAVVLSEHRFYYVRDFFDRLVVLRDGRIVEDLSREEALAKTPGELAAWGLRTFDPPQLGVGSALAESPRAALAASALTFAGERSLVLDECSFTAEAGRVCAIVGENGAGKSTLCRAVCGIARGVSGSVSFAGEPLAPRRRVRRSFFVQQDSDYQLYASTVLGEFAVGRRETPELRARAQAALEEVGLAGTEGRHPLSLSGGQKQRLLLALAATSGREVLVFDEPTSGLDGRNMRVTARLLRALADQGACILLITHDRELIHLVADDLLYLADGRVRYRKRVVRARADQ